MSLIQLSISCQFGWQPLGGVRTSDTPTVPASYFYSETFLERRRVSQHDQPEAKYGRIFQPVSLLHSLLLQSVLQRGLMDQQRGVLS